MRLSRRRLFKVTLGLGFLGASGAIFKSVLAPSKLSTREKATLRAYLDTLLPPVGGTVNSNVNVHEELLELAATDSKLTRVLRKGTSWLDKKAKELHRADFSSLGYKERESIVELAVAEQPSGSVPSVFYLSTADKAFELHYSKAESWPPIPYNGPPQPHGFLDYTSPWRASS